MFLNKDQTVATPTVLLTPGDKLHALDFLHSMHTVMQHDEVLEQGLNICDYTDIVMNVTPLLIAICEHPKFVDQATETLASLLEMVRDEKQSSSVSDVCFIG